MNSDFFQTWHEAAVTSTGLFWTAFWAFGLGYLISSMIQVFITRERMQGIRQARMTGDMRKCRTGAGR